MISRVARRGLRIKWLNCKRLESGWLAEIISIEVKLEPQIYCSIISKVANGGKEKAVRLTTIKRPLGLLG
jgi:hypothetical protein